MAIKNIVAKGIGFSPGTKKWIPTHGFTQGAAAVAISGFIVSGEAVRLPAFSGQRVQLPAFSGEAVRIPELGS